MKRLVLAVVLVCSVAWQGMAQLATVEVNSAAQLLWNIQQFYQMRAPGHGMTSLGTATLTSATRFSRRGGR